MYHLTRLRGNQVQTLILNSFTKSVASHNKALQPTANPLRGLSAAEPGRQAMENATALPTKKSRGYSCLTI